jgi:hypothetical protein
MVKSLTALGALHGALAGSFVEDMSWPVDRASLSALVDIGLSVEQIARYFSVEADEVRARLDAEGMTPLGG